MRNQEASDSMDVDKQKERHLVSLLQDNQKVSDADL